MFEKEDLSTVTEKSLILDDLDFEFSAQIPMVFNINLSQISSFEVSEFMGIDSVLNIFDHEEPTNILDQAMMVSELDLLNEAFIQDSQISLRLGESGERVLSN